MYLINNEKLGQTISLISKVGQKISKFYSASEIHGPNFKSVLSKFSQIFVNEIVNTVFQYLGDVTFSFIPGDPYSNLT
jgi:hypothetical protein